MSVAEDKIRLQTDIYRAVGEFESKNPGISVTDIKYYRTFTGTLRGMPKYLSYVIVEAEVK